MDLLGGAQTEQAGLHLLEEQPGLRELLPEAIKEVRVSQRLAAMTAGPARNCWRENENRQIPKVRVKPEPAAGWSWFLLRGTFSPRQAGGFTMYLFHGRN